MTFKKMVLSAVSASGILLAVSAIAPASLSVVTAEQADTSISVNFGFGSFYDRLEPYGNWVSYQDDYVFVPQHLHQGWRPYTLGHWSFTRRYGWLWVSNERFGWATYHYGRWGYSRDIGWYWVPGHRWAPAWVAWSRGQNEVAWAPLPPRHGDDLDVNITIGDVPDYYWQAVPVSAFLSINLADSVIRDRNQVRTIVQQSPPQTVRIENNIVINNVIQVNDIEKATNTKVTVLAEKPVTTPDAVGKTDANSVAIFNPDVKVDTTAKPKVALKVEQVVTARKAAGILLEDVPTDSPAAGASTLNKNAQPPTPTGKPAAAAPTLDKNGKPIMPPDLPTAKVQVPANGKANTDAPAILKQDQNSTPALKPTDLNAPKTDAPGISNVNKSKDAVPAITPPPPAVAPVTKAPAAKIPPAVAPAIETPANKAVITPPVDKGKATTDTPVDLSKKKKDAGANGQQPIDQNVAPPADAQTLPPKGKKAQEPVKKDEKGKVKCDPNVETCPAAQ